MKTKIKPIKKPTAPKSITFILWISFFCLCLLTVICFAVGEINIMQNASQERTIKNLDNAGQEIMAAVNDNWLNDTQISGYLVSVSEKYDISARILSIEGEVLFPRIESEESQMITNAEEWQKITENVGRIYSVDKNVFAYTQMLFKNGEEMILYLTDTAVLSDLVFGVIIFQTAYIAFIMMMIASVLAAAVSAYISRPIADLTEKAHALSLGNLNVNFTPDRGVSYREIVELSETLNYAESELSKTEQMQKELIANVSHDFKTPLTMIKAYASMIQEISGENPQKREQHAQVIIDEADRLTALVNDMLALSKLRADIEKLNVSRFNLSEYLQEIIGRFNYLSETAGYCLACEIVENIYVEADKEKIGQVLYNLIGNAVNYTGEDKTVFIRLQKSDGVAHFSVIDTGMGIASEELNVIWERYYRSKEMHKRPVKGTGLGLSIVQTVLKKHGFNFGVISEMGKGSTFYVDFPV